ncbi:Histidine kinase-, DNA gyrase B-, and HSP90-like ATPase [Bryocella elongata]|uniref:histidine kinase n=1 Tax=Bryocella elongata TaxID=863522 RepID=A0A1H5WFU6_9BACT|nr:Histidine kinase-, DNA gyrase B-, and HSP90-like ATPase [Bryocella elongata]
MQALPQSFTAARFSLSPPRSHTGAAVGSVLLSGAIPEVGETTAVAHDAANILSALLLYCDLLQQPGVLRPRHLHYARELNELARRSSGLVERLLDQLTERSGASARVSAHSEPAAGNGRPPIAGKSYLPATKFRQMEPLLRSLAFPYAKLEMEIGDGLDEWATPPAESLERIVVNLVCHAAQTLAPSGLSSRRPLADKSGTRQDATPKGRIAVTLRRSGKRTLLEVTDNGPGISAEMAAAFLLPSDPMSGSERGLGHRVVHELAGATGARLSIRSRPGQGSTFSLSWPAQRNNESSATGAQPAAPQEPRMGH